MNKSIKYLGFTFLGVLLLFTLGALRPFIASENGLAFGLTASNAVMVGSFRSMSGAVTNICADFSTPQHVRIMPQTANTGEFDIGDPAQSTGRYLMFSKLAGTFLLGHDGTDAFRVNVANGYVTMPGGALFGDGTGGIFEVNANAQFEIDPLGQMLLNGDDTVASHRSEIFLHGTNAHIRLDLGAPIEDWTAVTHLTMAPGSASLDGAFKVSGSGGSIISQSASNGLGSVNIRPDFTMANTQTVVWPTNLPAVGQHLGVKATNWYGTTNLEIQTDWETAGGASINGVFDTLQVTNNVTDYLTPNPTRALVETNATGKTAWRSVMSAPRRKRVQEWLPNGGSSPQISSIGEIPTLNGTLAGVDAVTNEWRLNSLATAASTNSHSGYDCAAINAFYPGKNTYWSCAVKQEVTNSNQRLWLGLTSKAVGTIFSTDSNVGHAALVRASTLSNDLNYVFITDNNSGSPQYNFTSVATTTNVTLFEIIEDSVNFKWYLKIDGAYAATNTTPIPAGAMQSMINLTTLDAVAKKLFLKFKYDEMDY